MATIGDFYKESDLDFSKLPYTDDHTLRDYQIENKKKVYEAWTKYRSVMLQMPTGTGKTKLFASILKDLHNLAKKHRRPIRVLILVHREELLNQISEELGVKYNLAHAFIHSGDREQKKMPIQIASVQTLNRRLERWEDKKFDVIIIDEAHHVKAESYNKIIDRYKDAKILGLTATPYRLNGAGFRPQFEDLIISAPVIEFIKKGYLSDYEYYSIGATSKEQESIDNMRVGFSGDYAEDAMMSVMDTDNIRAGIVDTYLKYARGKKGIVYTVNKAHNIHLKEKFNSAGIKAEAIDSDTSSEDRANIITKFKAGSIDVLCNVNIFSEGFDCPSVEFIQLARPTKSLSMYLQQVGRGLRRSEEKDKVIILDNVGLYNKFGYPSVKRKWRYHFEGKEVKEYDKYDLEEDNDDARKCNIIDISEGDEEVTLLYSSENEKKNLPIKDFIQEYKNYANSKGIHESFVEYDIYLIKKYIDDDESLWDDKHYKSVFYILDVVYLKNIRDKFQDKILNNSIYQYSEKKQNVFQYTINAIDRYIQFAQEYQIKEQDAPQYDENIKNVGIRDYSGDFRKYLKNQEWDILSINYTIDIIRQINDLIRKCVDDTHDDLFNTIDVKKIESIYNDLKSKNEWIKFNAKYYTKPSRSLEWYIDFARQYVPNSEKNENIDIPFNQSLEIQNEVLDNSIEGNDDIFEQELDELQELKSRLQKYGLSTLDIDQRIETILISRKGRMLEDKKKEIENILKNIKMENFDKPISINASFDPDKGWQVNYD